MVVELKEELFTELDLTVPAILLSTLNLKLEELIVSI
nr:MAG TPA: hypothetical protein [Caudoviricetes sp.]